MGENSKISWTKHTWNPWIGCTKVSPGCVNCYAESFANRYNKAQWGPTAERVVTSDAYWNKPLAWDRAAERAGRRDRVFVASLADVFEERSDLDAVRADVFSMIERCRNLDWLLLTKRPQNIASQIAQATGRDAADWLADNRHVWLGTSVEDQRRAKERIPSLLALPAAVRFLSMEPLLQWVDLEIIFHERAGMGGLLNALTGKWEPAAGDAVDLWPVDWVIVGGESGPRARPMHPSWVTSIREACARYGTPFHFKQWGEWALKGSTGPVTRVQDFGVLALHGDWYPKTTGWNGRPLDPTTGEAYMVKVGSKVAGRLLDGREWIEFPQ